MSGDYRPYVVRQGDYLARLAYVHGFDANEVWNHAQNAELREMGRTPELLNPGDILYLPVKPKEGLSFSAGGPNRYQAKVPTVKVSMTFKDAEGVLSDEPYEVHGLGTDGSSGQPETRKTDGNGNVELELPVTTREVTIVFPNQNVAYEVRVGDMDPVSEMSGVHKRLQNLGFADRDPHGAIGDTEGAIRAFQKANELSPTGALDDETTQLLRDQHGL